MMGYLRSERHPDGGLIPMRLKTLCFTWGLPTHDIESCHRAFTEINPGDIRLALIPITQAILPRIVRDVIDEYGAKPMAQGDHKPTAEGAFRMVLMHTEERGEIMQIMKRFKSVLANPNDVIFAMITDTAQGWTFQYYVDHVAEEHEYMKSHRPEDNPDMRPM
jgi:hypothetical protein